MRKTRLKQERVRMKTCSFCNITIESTSHPDVDQCPRCATPYGAKQQVKQIKINPYRPKKEYE